MAHEKDVTVNRYLSDPVRFADLFNGAFFGGKPLINADDLWDLETSSKTIIGNKSSKRITVHRHRDLIKKFVFGEQFAILACESQNELHYAMPIRTMLYDALSYNKQAEDIKKRHRKNNDLKISAEYLSGMKKTDTIAPVITLVVYFGEKPWDIPV